MSNGAGLVVFAAGLVIGFVAARLDRRDERRRDNGNAQ